jgi:cell division protein FtsB
MSVFRIIFSRQFLSTLVLIGLLFVFAVPLTKNWRQKQAIDHEIAEMEKQVAALEHKNSNLKQVLDYMQSDQFIEAEARTKLNYKKPGEQVTVIQNQPGQTPLGDASAIFDLPPAPPEKHDARLLGNLSRWLDYFFKK